MKKYNNKTHGRRLYLMDFAYKLFAQLLIFPLQMLKYEQFFNCKKLKMTKLLED